MPSPLEVLGLPEGSTKTEIVARYHELAMTQHPDYGGDAAVFVATHEAYVKAVDSAPAHRNCPSCNGAGRVVVAHGFSSIQVTCPSCKGTCHED